MHCLNHLMVEHALLGGFLGSRDLLLLQHQLFEEPAVLFLHFVKFAKFLF